MAHAELGVPSAAGRAFVPPLPNPFLVHDPEPSPALDVAGAEYVMVQSTGPVDPRECEELGVDALEVTVCWGTSVLHVAHLSPPRAFFVGHGEGLDYALPREAAPFERAAVVEVAGGEVYAVAPGGAALSVRGGGAVESRVALKADTNVEMALGAFTLRIAVVTAGKRLPRAVGVDGRGLGASLMVCFGAAAAFLGALAYYTPALGASLDDELDRDRLAILRAYLDAQAERERDQPPPDAGTGATEKGGGNPGTAAQGPEGKMGRPNRPDVHKRVAIQGNGPVELSRAEALAEARNIGMIGLLAQMNSRALPTAPWGADMANGPDASDAWGNMWGDEPGESGGFGGLGLTGTGYGGGGYGKGIGIDRIGTCGTNCGFGVNGGDGFGNGVGRAGGKHETSVPQVRMAKGTIVSGRLPAELIQRVVRQNYGRFRACYEGGLRANPNLTGRVTARFIISRDGTVTNAANGGSDLPDSKVVSCVIGAFYGLSFPSPENGIVTVSYPIMLTPS
ncbi:MAG TPA: AgmX/PglI C-terminal domain-containing protein [Polyangiaceae bacterium]